MVLARADCPFPARFILVLAASPCPCASALTAAACTCTPLVRRRYLAKLSGPLLDRGRREAEFLPVGQAAQWPEAGRAGDR